MIKTITRDVVKDIIYRSTIKRQTTAKIVAESNVSDSSVRNILRAHKAITAGDWEDIKNLARTINGSENILRLIEEEPELEIPTAVWNELNKIIAEFKESQKRQPKVEKPQTINDNTDSTVTDNTALAIAGIMASLDRIEKVYTEQTKVLTAICELLKGIGFELSDLPSKEIAHKLTSDVVDAINNNFDVVVRENRNQTNELKCTLKKKGY